MKQFVVSFSVEKLPGRLTTGISNYKDCGDVIYEHDSQTINTKVSNNPGTHVHVRTYITYLCMYVIM